jgi:hypothetical protein
LESRIAEALSHPLRARSSQRLGERVASPDSSFVGFFFTRRWSTARRQSPRQGSPPLLHFEPMRGPTLQLVAGEASLLAAIGRAILAPALTRPCHRRQRLGPPADPWRGRCLGVLNASQRRRQMAGPLMPIVFLTAVVTAPCTSGESRA